MVVSLLALAMPVVAALWYLVASDDGAPPESFWLIVVGVALSPLTLASATYAIHCSRVSRLEPAASN